MGLQTTIHKTPDDAQASPQHFSPGDHWGEIPQVKRLREHIASLKKAEEHRPRRWDVLDIGELVRASLDGFSAEFHGCAFDELADRDAKRILVALADHTRELAAAYKGVR